ncbi:unnamed protein product, partial [Dicrocoelium dendriticum]
LNNSSKTNLNIRRSRYHSTPSPEHMAISSLSISNCHASRCHFYRAHFNKIWVDIDSRKTTNAVGI